jgi:phosphatidylglycerophosphate synthase
MTAPGDRRPIAARGSAWAEALTYRLAATAVTPNQISALSMVAAALAGGAFWLSGGAEGAARACLLLAAAVFIVARLLCNLLDGMLAVEAGRGTPKGAVWNELPDRVADILILAGAGMGADEPALGWAAAAFAVLTAYVRELGRATGQPADFGGPMAKPQRMWAMVAGALGTIAAPLWGGAEGPLVVALWAVAIGAAVTAALRARRLLAALG